MSDNNVEQLDHYRPSKRGWNTGQARCLQCEYEFIATAIPGDQTIFKCPNCECTRAVFKHAFVRTDEEHWTCNCGNDLYHITRQRIYCPNCGIDLDMDEIGR